jgi:hypothetical protein
MFVMSVTVILCHKGAYMFLHSVEPGHFTFEEVTVYGHLCRNTLHSNGNIVWTQVMGKKNEKYFSNYSS